MNILLNEPAGFPASARAALQAAGRVYLGREAYPAGEIEAVFIRLRERLDPAFHRRHPALKYIVSPTTGLDHIDTEYFSGAGVKVISLRGRTDFLDNIHATAEHTLALTLALLRRLPAAATSVTAGQWDRYPFQGRELFGKNVLLVGYGRLGRQVEPIFSGFGCRVRAYDIVPAKVPPRLFVPLEAGLADADVVSLHVSLDRSTAGFFSAALLSRMKPSAILVNTARGELLDQEALLAALEVGRLAGAALDVLRDEPAPLAGNLPARLAALQQRLVITPHIGGFTHESLESVEQYITGIFLSEQRGPAHAP